MAAAPDPPATSRRPRRNARTPRTPWAKRVDLDTYLTGWGSLNSERRAVANTVLAIAGAARGIAHLVSLGELAGAPGSVVGGNSDGDAQRELDVRANELLLAALQAAPVAFVASEEFE